MPESAIKIFRLNKPLIINIENSNQLDKLLFFETKKNAKPMLIIDVKNIIILAILRFKSIDYKCNKKSVQTHIAYSRLFYYNKLEPVFGLLPKL